MVRRKLSRLTQARILLSDISSIHSRQLGATNHFVNDQSRAGHLDSINTSPCSGTLFNIQLCFIKSQYFRSSELVIC